MIAADVTGLEPLLDKGFAHIHSRGTVDTRPGQCDALRPGDSSRQAAT